MIHHEVQLQPCGRLARMEWDPETERHVERAVETDELAFHLHDTICFAEGTTLRDLLALVGRDQDLFTALTACDCLGEILDESGRDEEAFGEISALEFAWATTAEPAGATMVVDSVVEFYGLGEESRIALEFMSASRLAGVPILLNEAFNIEDNDDVVFRGARRFTLLDVVCGAIGELTFLGSPQERDEAMADLRERVSSSVDDGEFHTVEEVRAEWNRRAEEDRKRFPCRICGADSRCACFRKPPDLCHGCFNGMKEN